MHVCTPSYLNVCKSLKKKIKNNERTIKIENKGERQKYYKIRKKNKIKEEKKIKIKCMPRISSTGRLIQEKKTKQERKGQKEINML